MMAVSLSAQKTEVVELKQSIKDRKGTTKSITVIDNRPDKEIGNILHHKETFTFKFANDDLKNYIENWFLSDNKTKGNNDIILLFEELKVYNGEQEGKYTIGKTKIKFSSFIKKNNKYYFLNRIQNVIISDQKLTPNVPRNIVSNISNIMCTVIRESYTSLPFGVPIPEEELMNYEKYLIQNSPVFSVAELKDGVYKDFKSFYEQKPEPNYITDKNKKGRVTNIKDINANVNEEIIYNEEVFGYIENGKAYRSAPVGYLEILKDDKGFFVIANPSELYLPNDGGAAATIAMSGGLIGGLIGGIVDYGSDPRRRTNNVDTSGMPNVYLDSLTGKYIFE